MSSSKLSVGIVGLPNVGKSTLFNALLKQQQALAANYPFATIEPNVGIVPVPDERLKALADIVKTTTIKPATVEFVDIAGLVKGASKGEGLGNQFLANIREVNLIAHVVRGFTDGSVLREGSVDPSSDRQVIEMELMLADLSTVEKQKPPKGKVDKDVTERWEISQQFKTALESEQTVFKYIATLPEKDHATYRRVAQELGLLTSKPILYVVNVDESVVADQQKLSEQYAQEFGVSPADIVIISAKIESEVSSLADEDAQLFLADLGLEKSGLERLIETAYAQLGLQSFLTAGEVEVRAWTITRGMAAPQAAAVIHTDFEKHFIKANVVSYADFTACGGWKRAREQGKLRQEGRDYVMQEGDVVEFMIGK